MPATLTDRTAHIAQTFQGASESVFIVSADGRLVWLNGATDRLLGISEEALGSLIVDHWPRDAEQLSDVLNLVPPAPRYLTLCRPGGDGATGWWNVSIVPFCDSSGEHCGYLLACRNITEARTRTLAREILVEETRLSQRKSEGLATRLMHLHSAPHTDFAGDIAQAKKGDRG